MSDHPRWFDTLLGLLPVGGGLVIVFVLLFIPVPVSNQRVLDLTLGLIFGWGATVVNNRFGSSKGSERKTEALLTRPAGTPRDPIATEDAP